jgi:hypothetical protein
MTISLTIYDTTGMSRPSTVSMEGEEATRWVSLFSLVLNRAPRAGDRAVGCRLNSISE